MNSDEKRLLRHLESYSLDNPTIYTYIYNYYSPARLADRLLTPGFLVPLALLAALLYHHFTSESTGLESLPHLLWDVLVRVTPARLLYALDTWLHPPLFPLPMLQTQTTRSTSHAAKSEVLRRVLGMDRAGGIMASVSQAGYRSFSNLSPTSILKADPDKPAGLGNTSNSCYQNSVLQGLASLKPLRTYLASVDTQLASEKKAGTVATLRDLVADLNDPSNNGRTLWTPSVLKSMSTWQQQDAQEYFSKLLDEVDREMARLLSPFPKPAGFEGPEPFVSPSKDDGAASQHSDDSGYHSQASHSKTGVSESRPTRNPLEGLQAQRVACTACGHSDGLSLIPFNCVTLNLGTDGAEHDLYERLDSFTRVEPIAGVECARCTLIKYRGLVGKLIAGAEKKGTTEAAWPEPYARLRAIEAALEEDELDDDTLVRKCKIRLENKVASTKTKQAVVARPPMSLVVHMNRSVFDERTGRMWKNMAGVRFPTVLDLGPWCLGSAQAPAGRGDEEQWLLDPGTSMVAGAEGESKILGPVYELRAVITHHGRHENGHYVCYRRHPRGEGGEKPARLAGEEVEVDEVDGIALEGEDAGKGGEEGRRQEEEMEESQWWRLSDQDVTKVDEETVLAQSGVFMLFYDCVDPNSTLASEVEHFVDSVALQDVDGVQNDVSGAPESEPPREASEAQPPADEEKPKPPTRAEMIARAKILFARTAETAAAVPLPDEDEDL
ncbi:cysteine proteinase [Coniochaeta ligniaria NRRL 30616]|uniref:ubiquitinyl hydrolase 1 n=1 Tax=Coniochaeta ligniaria NRRL 30616 TaxID=1408157 RepID=A0A1J7IQ59_9PEZI|nr:cysteine proteinase [Coniochaeta ligniaria NRRL 30616]